VSSNCRLGPIANPGLTLDAEPSRARHPSTEPPGPGAAALTAEARHSPGNAFVGDAGTSPSIDPRRTRRAPGAGQDLHSGGRPWAPAHRPEPRQCLPLPLSKRSSHAAPLTGLPAWASRPLAACPALGAGSGGPCPGVPHEACLVAAPRASSPRPGGPPPLAPPASPHPPLPAPGAPWACTLPIRGGVAWRWSGSTRIALVVRTQRLEPPPSHARPGSPSLAASVVDPEPAVHRHPPVPC